MLIYNAAGVPVAAGLLYPFTGMLISPMFAAFAMSASLTFEQTYSEVEGDSAAVAELAAILSSLADLPNEVVVQKWKTPMCPACAPQAGFEFRNVTEWVA